MDLNITRSNDVIRVATHGNGVYERKLLSTVISDVSDDEITIAGFRLEQNYPNPFNPTTKIKFQVSNLPAGRQGLVFVTLKVYDVLGNLVTTLVNENKFEGNYEVDFDGSNLSAGAYFYRLQSGSQVETKKMILLK
ncbi:MAG: T9SS type A sorting domain-containing protein [Ignavibacterium sp.]|nr:MAG: T9SS type A sorting domain-containing protein [Ignavibacterium sp.]